LLPPLPDLLLVPLQRSPHRPMAAPAQLPQNAPRLCGVVLHPAFVLDQMGHTPRSPQARSVTQHLRPTLQPSLNTSQILGPQPWLTSRASRFTQRPLAALLQFLGPSAHRLSMPPDSARHLRLVHALP